MSSRFESTGTLSAVLRRGFLLTSILVATGLLLGVLAASPAVGESDATVQPTAVSRSYVASSADDAVSVGAPRRSDPDDSLRQRALVCTTVESLEAPDNDFAWSLPLVLLAPPVECSERSTEARGPPR